MVPKAEKNGSYTCINVIVQQAQPVNKGYQIVTQRGYEVTLYCWGLSQVDMKHKQVEADLPNGLH